MSCPLVSILMPVKNASRFLRECLDSILLQDYRCWELVAIDDHSEDASREILAEYSERDSRIFTFQNPGIGIIPALEAALQKAKGQLVTRMDADDLMPENRLSLMSAHAEPGKITTGMVRYFSDGEVSPGYIQYEKWLNSTLETKKAWENIYRECVIASPNWMMMMEDLKSLGGFSKLTYPEDYDLVFQWYRNRFDVKFIPETTLLWREHPERTSRKSTHYSQEYFFRLKITRFLEINDRKGPLLIWGSGKKAKLTEKVLKENNRASIQLNIDDYKKTESFEDPQVLLAVYPEEEERLKIKSYLDSIGLKPGKNYWYL